jgi:hypothetical protein
MRILILSASVGAGHLRAAEAVELALRRSIRDFTIANHYAGSLKPPPFRKVYPDDYFDLVARSPRVLGASTRRPIWHFHHDRLQWQVERADVTKLRKKIQEFNADVAICTHFPADGFAGSRPPQGPQQARIITIVTDFEVPMWLGAPSDHYFVATHKTRANLEALGIGHWASRLELATFQVFRKTNASLSQKAADPKVSADQRATGLGSAWRSTRVRKLSRSERQSENSKRLCFENHVRKAGLWKQSRLSGITTDQWVFLSCRKVGAGDGGQTRDVQLGK